MKKFRRVYIGLLTMIRLLIILNIQLNNYKSKSISSEFLSFSFENFSEN